MKNRSNLALVALFFMCALAAWSLLQAAPPMPWVWETQPESFYAQDAPERAPKLWGAPYVTNATQNSAVVNWVSRAIPVALGETAEKLDPSGTGWRLERVALTGLKPGTTYYYDVLRDGSSEGRGQFITAPRPGTPADVTFIVYGDTRTRHDMHRLVANKIGEQDYQFVLHTGDLVADGGRYDHWPPFFENGSELLRKRAIFPVLGNHERNSPHFYELFNVQQGGYYSFDWGNAHFALLNSDAGNYARTAEAREKYWVEQAQWLDRDLRGAANRDYRFVVFHHPPYSARGDRHASAALIAERLTPIFRKHGVQAVFGGHDHNYQHHFTDGIRYIVTGGGGAPLAPVDSPVSFTLVAERVENFVIVKLNGKTASVRAVSLDGRVLDTFTLEAAASPLAKPEPAAAAAR